MYIKDYVRDSPTGIAEIKKNEITIFPNPVTNTFYLSNLSFNSFDVSTLKITDTFGKETAYTCSQNNENVEIKLEQGIAPGCYIVQYKLNNELFTKKLLKGSE